MSEIALYNILKKIDGTTDDEIEKAVSDVARAKDVATKLDIAEIKESIAKLEARLTWRLVIAAGLIIGILKFWQ